MSSSSVSDRSEVSMSAVSSVENIRRQFPALKRCEGSNLVAYFDGPGGTQVPQPVVDAMSKYMINNNANTHWAYPTSVETDSMLHGARSAMADFLGGRPGDIAFGANMTTLLFHIARAIGRSLKPGDEIVVTELDHHANIAPWQALVRERGVVLRWLPFDQETFRHQEGVFENLISDRTRVVALGAASNALGTVTDVAAMVKLARDAGATTVVDAVHYAPHFPVDAQAINADFLLCSAYKFYGPHVGVVRARPEAVVALELPRLEPAPSLPPECLETGTQNHEGIAGAAAAVDFLAGLLNAPNSKPDRRARLISVMHELESRSEALFAHLWEGLRSVKGVALFGPPPGTPRTATLSFRVDGMASRDVSLGLARQGLYVSHGDFYASTVARRLGFADDGFVRVGCAAYTTLEEIERLVDGVGVLSKGGN